MAGISARRPRNRSGGVAVGSGLVDSGQETFANQAGGGNRGRVASDTSATGSPAGMATATTSMVTTEAAVDTKGTGVGWAHVAWILVFVSQFTAIFKGATQADVLVAGTALRIVVMSTAGTIAFLCILGGRNGLVALISSPQRWFVLYGCFGMISAIYASHGSYSLWKAIEVTVDALVAVAVLAGPDPARSVTTLYKVAVGALVLILVSVWLGAVYAPGQTFTFSKGILPFQMRGALLRINPNSVGFAASVVGLAGIAMYFRSSGWLRKSAIGAVVAAAMVTLLLAQSRTGVAGFLAAVTVYSICAKRRKLLAVMVVAIIAVISTAALREVVTTYLARGEQETQLKTMTGRTVMWQTAWDYFREAPIGGHGFGSSGRFDLLGGGRTSTLHGSIIEVLVGVGVVGFAAWCTGLLATMFRLGRAALRARRHLATNPENMVVGEILALAFLLLLKGITSSGLALHEVPFFLLMVVVAFASVGPGLVREAEEGSSDESVHGSYRKPVVPTARRVERRIASVVNVR